MYLSCVRITWYYVLILSCLLTVAFENSLELFSAQRIMFGHGKFQKARNECEGIN